MNKEETIAKEYLEKLEIGVPIYEPDGNIPPDFSIGALAVEVRRLNQNYFRNSPVEGLEQKGFSVPKILEEVLRTFDRKQIGKSYWVGIHYRRPIGDNKQLKKLLKKALSDFLLKKMEVPATLIVRNGISLNIFGANKNSTKVFKHAATSDGDAAGFVYSKFINNVFYCIKEKSEKILLYKNKYNPWWLILVNRMGIDIDSEDIVEVRSYLKFTGNFDKVIILDSTNLDDTFIISNGL